MAALTGRKKVKQRIQTHHTELVDIESLRRWRHPHTTVHIYVKTLPTGDEAGFTVQNHWTIDYLHFLCVASSDTAGWCRPQAPPPSLCTWRP